jgi:DNA-binding response OmpR family regulator
MARILIVANPSNLIAFQAFLVQDSGVEVLRASTGREALEILGGKSVSTVVVDEVLPDWSAQSFVRKLTSLQPLINCAMVSSLTPEDFHEATEGLGIFMQLPVDPGAADAGIMLRMLETIKELLEL